MSSHYGPCANTQDELCLPMISVIGLWLVRILVAISPTLLPEEGNEIERSHRVHVALIPHTNTTHNRSLPSRLTVPCLSRTKKHTGWLAAFITTYWPNRTVPKPRSSDPSKVNGPRDLLPHYDWAAGRHESLWHKSISQLKWKFFPGEIRRLFVHNASLPNRKSKSLRVSFY